MKVLPCSREMPVRLGSSIVVSKAAGDVGSSVAFVYPESLFVNLLPKG